jgi:hypothetical protein
MSGLCCAIAAARHGIRVVLVQDRPVLGGNMVSKPFIDGNAVFSFSLIGDAGTISPNVDFNLGILPVPKWDEAQEKYQTALQRFCYALIPTTVQDEAAAGAVLEAIASETYRTLVPAYCDIMLKTRYSNNEEVSEMYALILDSIIFDPGNVFATNIGSPTELYRSALDKNVTNWVSTMRAQKKVMEKKFESLNPQ